jgi:hypothetical protein
MITRQITLPLDDEGFFRRECPLCRREFKVHLKEEELGQLAQCRIDDYLVEQRGEEGQGDDEEDESAQENFCPYCGQSAPSDYWWTQEQLAYLHVIAENIMARLLNEHLIRPLNRNMGHGSFIRFEGKEMEQKEEWISPETTDMTVVDLPCCERRVKVVDDWKGAVCCFFCGFPHEKSSAHP